MGGQATPPRSTRTPSPFAAWWCWLVATLPCSGGDAVHVGTDKRARQSNCAKTLKASGTVLGWRHPLTPRCSVGVKSRWFKGVTQPSRLTCWAHSAAGSLPYSRCAQGRSWRRPATPLSCRGNQALTAGSKTRLRLVDGRVC